jgi:hypothetical protein
MKKISLTVLCIAVFSANLVAQETPEETVKRMAALGGDEVQDIKIENGKLKSLKVVGKDRISSVLGTSKGLLTAQKRAKMKANAAFVEWMKNHVKTISSTTDESIVTLQGESKQGAGEKGDSEKLTEQGKAVETTKQEIATQAQGMIQGLELVGKHVDPETKTLTLVYAWSAARAKAAKEAGEGERDADSNAKPGTKKPDAPVKKKTTVSPNFNE